LYRDRVQDGEIVAAIVAGEPDGLAEAYDRYAPALYAYCRSLLTEPADAADAVQDTFIITVGKVGGLRDPDRLRPWLYAVARNECFRRLRARGLSAPLDDVGDIMAAEEDPSAGPEREELRALVASALAGLNPGDREVIELNLRHVLDGPDLADALGVSRNQAHALVSRARDQFEGSLGALLVARAGRYDCQDLDDILEDWDGNLTVLLRKRVNRHIQNCEICGERKSRELSPAMLLSLLPLVALPASLRDQVFRVVSDRSPAGIGYRDLVLRRAAPFDRSGFPEPIDPPGRVVGVRTMTAAASAAVIAAALLGTGTVYVLDALHHKGATPVSAATLGPNSAPAPLASGSDPASAPAGKHNNSGSGGHSGGGEPASSPQASPSPATSASSPSQQGGGNPNPTPSHHSHSSSPPPSSPPPSPGTLSVSTTGLTLTQGSSGGAYTGTFTITAVGGPVSGYSIVDPAPAGDLSVAPTGGSLASGGSVTVSITVASSVGLQFETDLTVDPGGLTVAVDYPPAG
jgi:RNA polymerase sigma factor (sigma-70 family)